MSRRNMVALIASVIVAIMVAGVSVLQLRDDVTRLKENLVATRARENDTNERLQVVEDELTQKQSQLERSRRKNRRLETKLSMAQANERPDLAPIRWTMPDGEYFGYIAGGSFSNDPRLELDIAQWFVGEEANQTAIEDGAIDKGDTVPNDYYIRNVNPQLRLLFFAPDARITLSTWTRGSIPREKRVSLTTFGRIISEPRKWESAVLKTPYWITVSEGRIVGVEQQYVP